MFTVFRYLLAGAMRPLLAALVLMVALVLALQSLRFLDFMVNKGFSVGLFFELTLLTTPLLLTVILPLAALAGAVVALKRLHDDGELIALYASGNGPAQLAAPFVVLGLAVVASSYALFWSILPASTTAFKDLQHRLRGEEGHVLLEEGTFNQLGEHLMVYVRARTGPTSLAGLLVHDTRDAARPVSWLAEGGDVSISPAGTPLITLSGGVRQEVAPGQVSMLQFKRHTLDIAQQLATTPLGVRMRESEEYGWHELWSAAAAPTRTGEKLRAEAIKRSLWPTTPLVLVMLALACLLKPAGRQRRPLRWASLAAALGVLYVATLMALHGLAEDGSAAVLYGQLALPVVVVLACVYALHAQHRGPGLPPARQRVAA